MGHAFRLAQVTARRLPTPPKKEGPAECAEPSCFESLVSKSRLGLFYIATLSFFGQSGSAAEFDTPLVVDANAFDDQFVP